MHSNHHGGGSHEAAADVLASAVAASFFSGPMSAGAATSGDPDGDARVRLLHCGVSNPTQLEQLVESCISTMRQRGRWSDAMAQRCLVLTDSPVGGAIQSQFSWLTAQQGCTFKSLMNLCTQMQSADVFDVMNGFDAVVANPQPGGPHASPTADADAGEGAAAASSYSDERGLELQRQEQPQQHHREQQQQQQHIAPDVQLRQSYQLLQHQLLLRDEQARQIQDQHRQLQQFQAAAHHRHGLQQQQQQQQHQHQQAPPLNLQPLQPPPFVFASMPPLSLPAGVLPLPEYVQRPSQQHQQQGPQQHLQHGQPQQRHAVSLFHSDDSTALAHDARLQVPQSFDSGSGGGGSLLCSPDPAAAAAAGAVAAAEPARRRSKLERSTLMVQFRSSLDDSDEPDDAASFGSDAAFSSASQAREDSRDDAANMYCSACRERIPRHAFQTHVAQSQFHHSTLLQCPMCLQWFGRAAAVEQHRISVHQAPMSDPVAQPASADSAAAAMAAVEAPTATPAATSAPAVPASSSSVGSKRKASCDLDAVSDAGSSGRHPKSQRTDGERLQGQAAALAASASPSPVPQPADALAAAATTTQARSKCISPDLRQPFIPAASSSARVAASTAATAPLHPRPLAPQPQRQSQLQQQTQQAQPQLQLAALASADSSFVVRLDAPAVPTLLAAAAAAGPQAHLSAPQATLPLVPQPLALMQQQPPLQSYAFPPPAASSYVSDMLLELRVLRAENASLRSAALQPRPAAVAAAVAAAAAAAVTQAQTTTLSTMSVSTLSEQEVRLMRQLMAVREEKLRRTACLGATCQLRAQESAQSSGAFVAPSERATVCLPCGHRTMCELCASRAQSCPLCHTAITKLVLINLEQASAAAATAPTAATAPAAAAPSAAAADNTAPAPVPVPSTPRSRVATKPPRQPPASQKPKTQRSKRPTYEVLSDDDAEEAKAPVSAAASASSSSSTPKPPRHQPRAAATEHAPASSRPLSRSPARPSDMIPPTAPSVRTGAASSSHSAPQHKQQPAAKAEVVKPAAPKSAPGATPAPLATVAAAPSHVVDPALAPSSSHPSNAVLPSSAVAMANFGPQYSRPGSGTGGAGAGGSGSGGSGTTIGVGGTNGASASSKNKSSFLSSVFAAVGEPGSSRRGGTKPPTAAQQRRAMSGMPGSSIFSSSASSDSATTTGAVAAGSGGSNDSAADVGPARAARKAPSNSLGELKPVNLLSRFDAAAAAASDRQGSGRSATAPSAASSATSSAEPPSRSHAPSDCANLLLPPVVVSSSGGANSALIPGLSLTAADLFLAPSSASKLRPPPSSPHHSPAAEAAGTPPVAASVLPGLAAVMSAAQAATASDPRSNAATLVSSLASGSAVSISNASTPALWRNFQPASPH